MSSSSEAVRINMGDGCNHVLLAAQYPVPELEKLRDLGRCAECNFNGNNLWLCLAKDCKRIMCGDSVYDHSTIHYQVTPTHCLTQNLSTRRIWCHACTREAFIPTRNQTSSASSSWVGDDDGSDTEEGYTDVGTPKGLQNIGNTCYMNAALQALSNIPALSQYFTQNYFPIVADDKKLCLSRNFQRLLQDMCRRNGPNSLLPTGILYGIRNVHPMFRNYQQHDTQEFLRCLMDQLHEELKEPVTETVTSQINASELTRQLMQDMEEIDEDGSGDRGEGGASSGSQSDGDYETCDSGVSEQSSLSDEGDRASVKRKHSHSSSPPPRCKLPPRTLNFRGPVSPSKVKRRPPRYRSIISDLFDGKLLSCVECLTCNKVSTRVETFQDLSLPIPNRDHMTMLHHGSLSPQTLTTCNDVYKGKPTWVSWLWEWLKSWFWGPTVSLHDCLAAFFSADELKGDNMYSCEKCSKLRNGIKMSKVLDLPEVLCIHLKRFRHELAFSSKINSFVSFPLTGLDMRPYLHKDSANEVTSYDLSSVICHHGTAGGGHYTCYAINPKTKCWYELNDHCVTQVSADTVANVEGYVLFYRKNNEKALKVWEHAQELTTNSSLEQPLMEFRLSRRWINRLKTFAEPGPIDNSDFLCPHGGVHPAKVALASNLSVIRSALVWEYLYSEYKGGPACNELYLCTICQEEQELMRQRISYEISQFKSLKQEFKREENAPLIYALSMSWYRQWEAFVQEATGEPPGPIDNHQIVSVVNGQRTLKTGSDYAQVSSDVWNFFWNIYGGGPDLVINQLARGPSRASFSSGISVEREKVWVSASKAKSVESLAVPTGAGDNSTRSGRTHSVSSDNVNLRAAAATAVSHRKQQSLDNVRLDRGSRTQDDERRKNQRKEVLSDSEDNGYCPAFTPDELDDYVPFNNAIKSTNENVV